MGSPWRSPAPRGAERRLCWMPSVKSRETALANLKQQLESALLQDDRILSITDLNVTDSGRRFLTVSFTANTIFGAVGEEITANV